MPRLTAAALALVLAPVAVPAAASVVAVAEAKRGAEVTLVGTVERITDEDEFRLTDATGTIRVYVGPNAVPVAVGEQVTVSGRIDDDPGPLELYARELVRADGTRIAFSHRYE